MPLSAVDVINPAFERMKHSLFRPFRLRQWFRWALVGLFAGEIGQSSGCTARFPLEMLNTQIPREPGPIWPDRSPLFFAGLALVVVLGVVLVIILTYVSSRMRFVLFDGVVDGECRIRHSWNRRGGPAFRYFLFQLLVSAAGLLSIAVLFGLPLLLALRLGWLGNPAAHLLPLVLGAVLLFFLFFGVVIAMLLVHVLTKDFVVPQMAIDDVSVSTGWAHLWSLIKANMATYAGYIGMKILLAIAASVIVGIAGMLIFMILLIPFGGLGLVAVFAGQAAGIGWNPVTIAIAIVYGALCFLLFFVLACLASVPAVFFFPAYATYFFAERYPALHALLYPPPPLTDLSNPSPQPLPDAPA